MRATRLDHVGISPTAAMGAMADELRAKGRDIIALNAGESDFDTPAHIQAAAIDAIKQGKTRYTAVEGTPELIAAIAAKFKRDNHLHYNPDQIIASTGGKQAIANALIGSVNPGDEVLIPTPYWVSYTDMVKLAGGVPVPIPTNIKTDFKITPQDLDRAITEKTKWVIFNSPCNPSGAAYNRDEIAALSAVLLHHSHVWIMCDDIYEHLIYDNLKFYNLAQVEPKLFDRCLTINGVSKAYAMTGWRIGYAGGPSDLIKAMKIVQSQSTNCPNSIAQAAAVAALNGPQDFINECRPIFQQRRDFVINALQDCNGVICAKPQGAFYLYCGIDALIGKRTKTGQIIKDDKDFCMALLQDYGVGVVFGAAFGASPAFRISYAASHDTLRMACERICDFCNSLH